MPKYLYIGDKNGHKVQMNDVFGYPVEKGIVDVPSDDQQVNRKLMNNCHFKPFQETYVEPAKKKKSRKKKENIVPEFK